MKLPFRYAFKGLYRLKHLDLSTQKATFFLLNDEGVFDDNTRLEGLSLAGNGMTFLPKGLLSNMKSLEVLDLSNNKFTIVDE